MSQYCCARCQYCYEPVTGDITHGVMQETAWSDLPEDWHCPDCGAPKIDFSRNGGDGLDGSGWTAS